jgi:mycobactin peptide synthetase MbtE
MTALTEIREQFIDTEYEPPQGTLETTVAHIEAEVLGVDRVGRADSFYDFGGTSLQAIRICTRIERETGRQAEPAWLFDTDIVSEFAQRLRLAQAVPDRGKSRESGKDPAGRAGLSEGQVSLWLDGLVRPERALGNVVVLAYRLVPAPPRAALLAALRTFSARHQALATAIQADGDGLPRPVALALADAFAIDDPATADGSLQGRAEALAQRVNIEAGPLMAARADPSADGCDLLVAFHHACFDGHSEAVFSAELSALLRGETLPAAPPLAGFPAMAARPDDAWLADWGRRLAATLDVTWPQAGPDDQPGPGQSGVIRFDVPGGAASVAAHARAAGLAPFVLVLRAVARAIRDRSGTASFCLGVPTSVRDIGLDQAIGNFVRQTVAPVGAEELDAPAAAMAETWERARRTTGMGVSELARLAGRGASGRSRLFQVQFAWQNQPGTAWDIPGTVVSEMPIRPMAPQFDLTVELRPTPAGAVTGLIEYDAKVVPESTAAQVAEQLRSWFAKGAIA